MVVRVRRKTIVLGLTFAVAVYSILFIYVFGFAPMVTNNSQLSWIERELSKEIKFSDTGICKECHYQLYLGMKNHSAVNCEACHGPGAEHTVKRTSATIAVNRSRDACLKCHLDIEGRNVITTVSEKHHPGIFCVVCHDPHS